MMIANSAPTAPVISHLSPSITKSPRLPPLTRRAVVFNIDGSDPAPGAGSVIMKHERISPAARGPQPALFLVLFGNLFEEVHVGFVGGEQLSPTGPSGE